MSEEDGINEESKRYARDLMKTLSRYPANPYYVYEQCKKIAHDIQMKGLPLRRDTMQPTISSERHDDLAKIKIMSESMIQFMKSATSLGENLEKILTKELKELSILNKEE